MLYILSVTCLIGVKPLSTPMQRNTRLKQNPEELLFDPTPYRQLVGQLIYLTNTRPYFSYFVQQLSQFMRKHTHLHFEVALRVIRHIKSTIPLNIFYLASLPIQIKAFCDSD